jgi:hypothetical protein
MLNEEDQDVAEADAIRTILREWNILRDIIILFTDESAKLGVGKTKYRNAILDSVMRIHDAMQDTDVCICLLAVRAGSNNPEASNKGTDSVWESVWKIYKTTKSIRDDLDVAIGKYLDSKKEKNDVHEKMVVLDKHFKGLHQFSQENLTKLMERVRMLESKRPQSGTAGKGPDNRAFSELLSALETDVMRNSKNSKEGCDTSAKISMEINNLKRKFKTLEDDQLDEDVGISHWQT